MTQGRDHCPLCHGSGVLEEHFGPPHNPHPSGYTEPCDLCTECYVCGCLLDWDPPRPLLASSIATAPAWLIVPGPLSHPLRPHCPSCRLDLEDFLHYLCEAAHGQDEPPTELDQASRDRIARALARPEF